MAEEMLREEMAERVQTSVNPQQAAQEELPPCCRTKHRTPKEYRDLVNRLSRIEGQIRGIRGMVESDAYCIDIVTQVSAVRSALNSFNKVILADHIRTCVTEDVQNGNSEKVDELVRTLEKLMK